MKPYYSIIVPMFNSEDFINQCLESIQNQTFKDFEVIIVDDGSQDLSKDIAMKFVNEDHRFKILSQTNQGESVARNVGISAAKGTYIVFVDSDDLVSKFLLETVHSVLKNEQTDAVAYNLQKIRDNNEDVDLDKQPSEIQIRRIQFPDGRKELFLQKKSPLKASACTKAYRREVINKHGIQFDPCLKNGNKREKSFPNSCFILFQLIFSLKLLSMGHRTL